MNRAPRALKFPNYCSDPDCNWTLWKSARQLTELIKGKKGNTSGCLASARRISMGKRLWAEGKLRVVFSVNSNLELSFVPFLLCSPCYQISFGTEKVNSGALGQTGKFPVPSLGQRREQLPWNPQESW